MNALYMHPAATLARLIRTGDVSSREVIAAHPARIAEVNGRINAITVVLEAEALAAADAADTARRSGAPIGPLHGVPFTVKENIDCLGTATTHGLRALVSAMPYIDAPVVARMKAAGAIPIGRTNLSEMGLRLCTDNPLRGTTRNPRDPKLTAGGSSGGDAAAVATGMAPIGIGGDIGGSLRVPAHFCGVATLKPTTGRVPFAASLPPEDHGMAGQAMLSAGPMARSVEDLEVCLKVLAGRDVRDPRSVEVPLRGQAPEERRAALVTQLPGGDLPEGVVAAISRAGELLEAAGWSIEQATPPEVGRVAELWQKMIATDLLVAMPLLQAAVSPALFEHVMRICRGAKVHEISNSRIHQERSRLSRTWSGFFTEYPVVVGPNVTAAPWPLGQDMDPQTGIDMLLQATRFVLPGNALGLPVVALPVNASRGAIPPGIQIYADLWREDLCLEAAAIIEKGAAPVRPIDPAF